jgi:MFS family permease
VRELFRRREVRLYLTGQVFSLFGDTSLWLAAGIWVKQLTHSDAAAGMTYFFFALPALFAPAFGLLVDRVPRRRLLIMVNLFGAGIVLLLLAVSGPGQVWLIYAVMVLYGCCEILVGAGQQALLGSVVPGRLLADTNALLRTIRESMRIIAPLAGAAMFSLVGGGFVAVVDALTFLVAAWCVARMRVPELPLPRSERSLRTELVAGMRFLRVRGDLRRLTVAASIAMIVFGFTESAVYAVIDHGLHRPPPFFGVLATVQGIGSVIGGLSSAVLLRRRSEPWLVAFGLGACAFGASCYVLPNVGVVLVGAAAFGVGLPWIVVGAVTLLQRSAPDELQGRVYTAFDVATTVPQTISIALGAAMITILGYQVLLATETAVLLLSVALIARIRTAARAAA